jgi:sugar phosphate isomerase/epimerase
MQRILSTYRYVNQPLTPTLLEAIAQAGIPNVEIFCAPSHFNYRSMESIRELAASLKDYGLELHSLHSPTERNSSPDRDSGVPISISEPERIRRVDAVDEVKRALDVAETVPFRYLIQHLGSGRQQADPRNLDAAFNSLEHLMTFARHRGVTIAVENTPNELGSPASLVQFVRETRLNDLKFCFDVGHAHIEGGVAPGLELMRDRVVTSHIHDNHGEKDEHLIPSEGTVDWNAVFAGLASAPHPVALVLELKEAASGAPALDSIRAAFGELEKRVDEKGAHSTSSGARHG